MTEPGESQNSASSGVIFSTRIFGSSALSHQAFADVENSCLILARSLETTAVPLTETYFWLPASANDRLTFGLRAISSSLWRRASVRKQIVLVSRSMQALIGRARSLSPSRVTSIAK